MTGVRRIKLGSHGGAGLEVSAQGLGCMGMSAFYGPPKPDEEMIDLIHQAIDSGVTLLDTSDFYGPFTNENLIGKALKGGWREKVQLATKFGIYVTHDGKFSARGDPVYVRECCEGSLKRLGVDYIDLYYVHRIDTKTPIEVTMGELKKLVEEGKIKHVGLSEASPSTIRRAHAVHPVTAVQMEWSLWTRDIEAEIVPTCRELGIGIVAYSPLGRGFLSYGPALAENLAKDDSRKVRTHAHTQTQLLPIIYTFLSKRIDTRAVFPRFQPENMEHNKRIFERVSEIAESKGCTPAQLALAWVHHQGNDVCPIPGTTKVANLDKNVGAVSVSLTAEELVELEALVDDGNVKGDRYSNMTITWQEVETPPLSSWKQE